MFACAWDPPHKPAKSTHRLPPTSPPAPEPPPPLPPSYKRTHSLPTRHLGHLFARGESREAALRSMAAALRDCVTVRGEIRTTTDYVLDLLATPELTGGSGGRRAGGGRWSCRYRPEVNPMHTSEEEERVCVCGGVPGPNQEVPSFK